MSTSLDSLADALIFANGIALMLIGAMFLNLFKRYRKRSYLLLSLGFLSAAIQMTVGEMDVVLSEEWESGVTSIIAASFGSLMIVFLLLVILFPERVPIDFDEDLISHGQPKSESVPEDD